MTEANGHITFKDDASGEKLPIVLEDGGFTRRLFSQYAAKMAIGDQTYADLTE